MMLKLQLGGEPGAWPGAPAAVAAELALDEALLEQLDARPGDADRMRLWQVPHLAVVLGRASRMADEVDCDACRQLGVPLYRRCSGGAAVLIGPGCLMYSVVLSLARHPELRVIDAAHRYVLGRVIDAAKIALRSVGQVAAATRVGSAGTSDGTLEGRKFSGNSLRCKRDAILYHGTLLYDPGGTQDRERLLEAMPRCLRMPPRQPQYRRGRGHREFLTALPVDRMALEQALNQAWQVADVCTQWPQERVEQLVAERYGTEQWLYCR